MTTSYPDFEEDRATLIRVQLFDEDADGNRTPITAFYATATLKAYFRAFTFGGNTIFDEEMDKIDPAGDSDEEAKVETYITFIAAYTSQLEMRIVVVDTTITDTTSITGKREIIYDEFKKKVSASPQP